MTCPCKTKLTEAQKTLHNETSGTNLWQSPVSEKAGEVSGKLSQSLTKIASLATILSPLSPGAPLTNPLGMALQASGINSETIQSLDPAELGLPERRDERQRAALREGRRRLGRDARGFDRG